MVKTFLSMGDLKEVFKVKSRFKDYSIFVADNIAQIEHKFSSYQLVFVDDSLVYVGDKPNTIKLFCDENLKSWDSIGLIIDIFIQKKIGKGSQILIVGGGVLQDTISFVCSIFSRGVNFDFAPTTLLSMVDSCIGGKTSINFKESKNKIGTYFPPNRIVLCKDFLKSLDKDQILSGSGEIFKFCVLQNKISYFVNLFSGVNNISLELIIDQLKYKSKIIEIDEFDQKERLLLNYGHTFGHALEASSNYKIPHGIAVVIGLCVANRVSYAQEKIPFQSMMEIEEVASRLVSSITFNPHWFEFEVLIKFIRNDKKNDSNSLRMILFDNDSKSFSVQSVYESDLKKWYSEFMHDLVRNLKIELNAGS